MKNLLLFVSACFALILSASSSAQIQPGLDPTFGNGNGYMIYDTGIVNNITVLQDGKFIGTNSAAIMKFLSNGDLDPSFGNGGISLNPNPLSPWDFWYESGLVMLPDGKILVVETFDTSFPSQHFSRVIRLNSDGSWDTSFGNNGCTDKVAGKNHGSAVLVQPDGKILLFIVHTVPDSSTNEPRENIQVVRYLPNGVLDTDFGSGGYISHQIYSDPWHLTLLAGASFAPEGKIVLGGQTYSDQLNRDSWYAARLLPDGSLDTSFNHSGIAYLPLDYCHALAVQPDGKIILGGHNLFNPPSNNIPFLLARFNTNGTLDTDFDSTGHC